MKFEILFMVIKAAIFFYYSAKYFENDFSFPSAKTKNFKNSFGSLKCYSVVVGVGQLEG